MRRIIFLVFLILMLTSSTSAEEGYRLRVPSAGEYLHGVLEILEEHPLNEGKGVAPFNATLDTLLFLRYSDLYLEEFDTLFTVYERLGIGTRFFHKNRNTWVKALVHAWLRENEIDLSRVEHLRFADFSIDVYARDFNADGVDEYLLDIAKGGEINRQECFWGEHADYVVVQQNGSEYQFIDTPLPWIGVDRDIGLLELDFEDINADGLPEWILVDGGHTLGGISMGYSNLGQLYIVSWRNGKLVELTPQFNWNFRETLHYEETDGGGCPTMPFTVNWEFVDIDNDNALEVLQHQDYADNWYCISRETKVFAWDSQIDQYVIAGIDRTFAETQNCAQRKAEELMWQREYKAAISEYETGLTLPAYRQEYDIHPTSLAFQLQELNTLNQYMRGRLALAYILTEQPAKADTLLDELIAEEFTSEAIGLFVNALKVSSYNPLLTCATVYTIFAENHPDLIIGTTVELEVENREYSPEHMGCDAPRLIADTLGLHEFDNLTSPVEQLITIGLSVSDSIQADLDGDGNEEWLVWLNAPVAPILFAYREMGYVVSRPLIDPYRNASLVTSWQLPDDSMAVVELNFDYLPNEPTWSQAYYSIRGGGAPTMCELSDGTIENAGFISLWHMQEGRLTQFFRSSVCERGIASIFPDGEPSETLIGGEYNPDAEWDDPYWVGYPKVEPITYRWDAAVRTYTRPLIPTLTSTPQIAIEVEGPPYFSIQNALDVKDYEAVIQMTENLSGDASFENHFYRALALEALGRDDEALAEYVAIYEAAQESAWGMLAALHLEVIDGE